MGCDCCVPREHRMWLLVCSSEHQDRNQIPAPTISLSLSRWMRSVWCWWFYSQLGKLRHSDCTEVTQGRAGKRAVWSRPARGTSQQPAVGIHSEERSPVRNNTLGRGGGGGFLHGTDSSAPNTGNKHSGKKGPSRKKQGVDKQAIFNA